MLLTDWQFCTRVKGLVVPETGVVISNILFRGVPPGYEADIFFKITAKDEEKDRLLENALDELEKVLQIYGLYTGRYVQTEAGYYCTEITPEKPFGTGGFGPIIKIIPVFDKKTERKTFLFIRDRNLGISTVW